MPCLHLLQAILTLKWCDLRNLQLANSEVHNSQLAHYQHSFWDRLVFKQSNELRLLTRSYTDCHHPPVSFGDYEPPHDKTNKRSKTQISLGIRPVWSVFAAQWVAKDLSFLHTDSEDSDQTGWMPRLISVIAGHTSFCWFYHERLILLYANRIVQHLGWWHQWCPFFSGYLREIIPTALYYAYFTQFDWLKEKFYT